MSDTLKADRLTALDLSTLSEEEFAALRREAMQRGLAMSELLKELILEITRRERKQEAWS